MKLIIGNYNYSTWSMRPWLFVHYHQLPVDIVSMRLFSEQLIAELDHHFSNGKVPLLLDGELEVWDSLAILEYLGERFPHTSPWPAASEARAVARAVSAEMHSSFGALRDEAPMNIRTKFPGYALSESARRDITRIQEVWRYCRETYGSEGPWLFGGFSIADAMFAPVVMRFRSVEVDLDPPSAGYCQTMNACESVKHWISLAYGESDTVVEDELDWPSEPIPRDSQVADGEHK